MERDNLDKILFNRQRRYQFKNTNVLKRYNKGILSLAQAVRAFCDECVGNQPSSILDCCGFGCPLYFHRYKQYPDTKEIAKEINRKLPKSEISEEKLKVLRDRMAAINSKTS